MIIAIASGKGGVGKTFITANLAVILAYAGFKTIAVDMDVKLANLEIAFGMEGKPTTLQDVLQGTASLDEAIYETPYKAYLLPAGLSVDNIRLEINKMDEVLAQLMEKFDVILLDSPAGLDRTAAITLALSNRCVIVTNPEYQAVIDALKTKIFADELRTYFLGVVLNMVGKLKREIPKSEIENVFGKGKLLAVIPYDKDVGVSLHEGKPYVLMKEDKSIRREFVKLAGKVVGQELRLI